MYVHLLLEFSRFDSLNEFAITIIGSKDNYWPANVTMNDYIYDMEYKEALELVKEYQYLIGKKIEEKSTGLKSVVDYVTIIPTEGIRVYNNNWLHPMDLVHEKFLIDKDCNVFIIANFTSPNELGTQIAIDSLNTNYILPL